MLRKQSLIAVVCSLSLCFAATACASVTFTQAQLLGMTLNLAKSSAGTNLGNGTGIMTANPFYEEPVGSPIMTGTAGGIGNVLTGGTARYSLNAAGLAAFIASVGAGDTLSEVGRNDNNQSWAVGVWYQTAAGIVETFATIAAGTGAQLNLAVVPGTGIIDGGVAVRNVLTQADDYHASWSPVPEPTTIAVWAGLISAGAFVGRRRLLAAVAG